MFLPQNIEDRIKEKTKQKLKQKRGKRLPTKTEEGQELTINNPFDVLLEQLSIQAVNEDTWKNVWREWENLSDEEQKELFTRQVTKNIKKDSEREEVYPKVMKCRIFQSETVGTKPDLCDDYDLDLSEEDRYEEDIPDYATKFVEAFQDVVRYVNPDIPNADLDRALVAMSTQSGKWNEIIEQFPERQIRLHKSLLRLGPAALQPKV